jgi:hypothetical protein
MLWQGAAKQRAKKGAAQCQCEADRVKAFMAYAKRVRAQKLLGGCSRSSLASASGP